MNKIKHNPKLTFRLFLALYILGGLAATSLSLIYQYNKEYVGVAFLVGALVAVLLKNMYNNRNVKNEINKERFTNLFKISIVIYIVLCFMLIYIFMNSLGQYYLSLEYFIIIFLISGVILSQTLLIKDLETFKEKIIFLEIIFMSIIVSSVFLFLFPSPYGNDAPYHVEFINNSINAGFLIGQGQYQNYPVFHLLFIYIVELCKIDNFKIVQFILLVVQSSFLLFGFMLTKKIFNSKIALIAILILSFAPYISQPKYFYFPGSFTAILFLLSLYLVFYSKNISPSYSLLILISFLAIIFAHPMTPVILIVALVLLLLTSKFQSNKEKVSLTAILLILTITVSWWMKPSGIEAKDLFTYSVISIQNAIETVDFTAVGRATLSPLINQWTVISADLGFILLIMLSIIGSLYLLGNYANYPQKYKNKPNSIYLAIITLIFILIPYSLTIVYPQSLPNRWFPFIEIFASIFAGLGIYVIFNNIKENKWKFGSIIGVSCLIFLLVSNPVINPNSQLYSSELSVRTALTTSEIDSSNFISQYSNISVVKGNSKYIAFINPELKAKNYIDPGNSTTFNKGIIILRNYDIEKGFTIPLFGSKGKLLDIIYPDKNFTDFISYSNEIYTNGNLKMYFNQIK